ncbi:putative ANKRD40 C-terminal-like protein [Prorops nasuta]|uniref:putative ANKRD40 C-terminal-like protein n=1 Tax=Prorops nasuta TaxID=863751 RepID=UPI0034CFACED
MDIVNSNKKTVNVSLNDLVLKIRIANALDPDFIETELKPYDLTFQGLTEICCNELNLTPDQIIKIRKLPNTKLRNDRDVQRLENFQEIEVVVDPGHMNHLLNLSAISKAIPSTQTNGYQSISQRNQTVLY